MAGRNQRFGGRSDSEKSAPAASAEPVAVETATDISDVKKSDEQQETEIYHVVGPGSLRRSGEMLPPGELLELTTKEAKDLGAMVAPGEPAPNAPSPDKRKAGKYRVKGPGSVLQGGVFRKPGEELTLTEEDARSLGDAVVPV